MIVVNKFLVPKGFLAITIWPFIFVRSKGLAEEESLINHEKIHLRQQIELLLVLFYLWYGIEYLIKRIKLGDPLYAYRSLGFEVEAYTNENNTSYLKNRKLFSWFKHI